MDTRGESPHHTGASQQIPGGRSPVVCGAGDPCTMKQSRWLLWGSDELPQEIVRQSGAREAGQVCGVVGRATRLWGFMGIEIFSILL